ncbi:MAG: hypothetical protein ABF969_04220 [Sporolactobacillus sp.]
MLVQNKGDYVRHIGARLLPGVNDLSVVESKAYAEAAKHPLNKVLIDKEIFVVSKTDITAVDANAAIEVVNDTFDLGLLDKFKKAENGKRKTVSDAIDVQIESIKNPPEDKVVDQDE